MKEFLTVLTLVVSGCVGEAPYRPSGWRPQGPAFELPQKSQPNPQYLPALDPRNLPRQYGPPEVDVSVQGLPGQDKEIFQVSPINGQQNIGRAFNNDLKQLDEVLKQIQFQAQQERYREFERQKHLDNQPQLRKFAQKTTPAPISTTPKPELRTTTDPATEAINLNNQEFLDDGKENAKITVEVSKQRIQEFPPEALLSPLAQLNLQSQFIPLQVAQLRSPLLYQPGVSQKQVAGYDAETHFAAFPSVLAQQQLQPVNQEVQTVYKTNYGVPQFDQVTQNPQFETIQPQTYTPNVYPGQVQLTPGQNQYPGQVQFPQQATQNPQFETIQPQYTPNVQLTPAQNQYPGQVQYPQQVTQVPQFQVQGYEVPEDQTQVQPQQPQFVYQPQFQSQYPVQAQLAFPNNYQIQQSQVQAQEGNLQSGIDLNQGNGVEKDGEDDDENRPNVATAVATAFGERTQPRVVPIYGIPQDPRQPTQAQNPDDDQAEADQSSEKRKKNARLRSRRLRPGNSAASQE